MSKKVMLVFGTRPEAIKMAPVYRELRRDSTAFDVRCCVTAQHRHLLDQALDTFGIVPDLDLDLMRGGQNLANLHAAVLTGMREVLDGVKPDLVLVHGDTTTSIATAMAAFYAGIPIAHVEAGLRSSDIAAPFPEEFNRRTTATIARYHFAPTESSKASLLSEGCDPASIFVTGNTIIDALTAIRERLSGESTLRGLVEATLDASLGFDWRCRRFVIVTCHRRENFLGALPNLCAALDRVTAAFPDVHFVFPVHPNPSVRAQARLLLAGRKQMHLLDPLPYFEFVHLLGHCHSILTDSGGLQEEGPALGKPVLVMRNVTERPEGIAFGASALVGTQTADIVSGLSRLLSDQEAYTAMAKAPNPFGDGKSAERIVSRLRKLLDVERLLVPA